MTIVELITNEAASERRSLIAIASVAGLGNALILVFINTAAAKPDQASLALLVLIVAATTLYVIGARHTSRRATSLVETALHRIRTRIVAKIERTELEVMERIGTVEIMDRVTENISVISDSATHLARLLQSLCITLFATIYLAWTLLPGFAVIALLIAGGASIYLSKEAVLHDHLKQSARARVAFAERVTDLLKGFKEVKFSRRRGRDLYEDAAKKADLLRGSAATTEKLLSENTIFVNVLQFAVLGAIVFVLPQHVSTDATTISALIAGVLFLWACIGGVVGGYPAYLRSNHALAQIEILEGKLDGAARKAPSREEAVAPWPGGLTTIQAEGIEYKYASENGSQSFHIGPIDLTIEAGEVLFIVGGNGSGKSTFLKVLTGLYPPSAGALRVSGVAVQSDNVASFREMISAIYSDFHLFAKLYGLFNVEEGRIRGLLELMKLHEKTSVTREGFSTRNLSTGQKKRLAMVVVMLEDRPLYVFDEWAADQDPEFRKYFYEELIPSLKRQGKTVIAVSHDDRYFRCADRVVTMEYGAIRSIERIPRESAAQGEAADQGVEGPAGGIPISGGEAS